MKRFDNVKAIIDLNSNIQEVTVLDYDRNKYCTIQLNNGTTHYVKKNLLYNLPQGFSFYYLPYDYLDGRISNKEIAKDIRKHKRYFYKLFSNFKTNVTVKFYISSDFNTLDYSISGTRKNIIDHFYSLPKDKVDNFSISLSFYTKNGSTFGSCFSYKNKKQTCYSFRNKKQDRYIRQLLRSLFNISIKN